jgi:hypothetical protein
MAEYIAKAGTGSAFKNENKTEDWHGDYTGQVTLPNGDIHYVNIYNNKGKTSGKPYLGLTIGKQVGGATAAVTESNEDVPF